MKVVKKAPFFSAFMIFFGKNCFYLNKDLTEIATRDV
jgi:hypothetical protein